MRRINAIFMAIFLVISLMACAGMSPREQRVLSGGAIGAGGGAAVGAITGHPGAGAAIGAGAGALGGLLYDQSQRDHYRGSGYYNDGGYGYYNNDYRYHDRYPQSYYDYGY